MTSAPELDLPSAPGLVLVVWPTRVIAAILPLGLMRASAFAMVSAFAAGLQGVSSSRHPDPLVAPWTDSPHSTSVSSQATADVVGSPAITPPDPLPESTPVSLPVNLTFARSGCLLLGPVTNT